LTNEFTAEVKEKKKSTRVLWGLHPDSYPLSGLSRCNEDLPGEPTWGACDRSNFTCFFFMAEESRSVLSWSGYDSSVIW
jgi:hypothetical protein